ncbi:MAG TPA: hypothetical protein PLO89_07325, partial [Spirochaetota bacterium]|nr:hypothetical protein [Spirochaetota bacterium]
MTIKQLFLISASLLFITTFGCAPEPEKTTTPNVENTNTTTTLAPVYAKVVNTKYVENRDKDGNVLFSWNYDATGKLNEYCVYRYDSLNRNDLITSYKSEATSDVSNYLGKYEYTYDGTTKNIIKSEQIDKSDVLVQSYVATYNAQGKYLTYTSKNGDGSIIENRVATYDSTGNYYLTETYYSDVTKDVILEKYTRTYDSSIAGRYLQEE